MRKSCFAIFAASAILGLSVITFGSQYTVTDLGSNLTPSALNDYGDVVGTMSVDGTSHAALWSKGTLTDLGALGGTQSEALAINNLGQITGTFTAADGIT